MIFSVVACPVDLLNNDTNILAKGFIYDLWCTTETAETAIRKAKDRDEENMIRSGEEAVRIEIIGGGNEDQSGVCGSTQRR